LKKEDFEKELDYHIDDKRSREGKVKGTGVIKANLKRSNAKNANIKETSVKKKTDNLVKKKIQ
jgi:hypothetical protein